MHRQGDSNYNDMDMYIKLLIYKLCKERSRLLNLCNVLLKLHTFRLCDFLT